VGEDRRRTERTDELLSELRDRVRSLENLLRQERAANRENRRIIASLTSRTPKLPAAPEPGSTQPERRKRRSYSSWWKERFGAAMVGVVTAFAVLTANSGENPLRVAEAPPGGEEQAGAPVTTQPAEGGPVGTEPVGPTDPMPVEPGPTEPVR
jgi:hypothetical protein